MIYAAIDPGLSGAAAVINEAGLIMLLADTPTVPLKVGRTKRDVYAVAGMVDIMRRIATIKDQCILVIENQRGMPGQGSPSVFSLGYGLGLWIASAAALRVPYEKVEPTKWKREMGVPGKADDNKGASVIRAQQLFPGAELTTIRGRMLDGRADALLIAEWVRRGRRKR